MSNGRFAQPAGLILDWGGVLTSGLNDAMSQWASTDGIDFPTYLAAMRDWFGPDAASLAEINPVHALERGELEVPEFEQQLAARLTGVLGRPVDANGLVARMFAHFTHAPDMAGLVLRARRSGIRTALLSNSWGNDYPRDGWGEMFDVVVISGEVGMRKPEERIYLHTTRLLGLDPGRCVFVDDLPSNVAAAVDAGLVGVRHSSYAETVRELEVLFDRTLAE